MNEMIHIIIASKLSEWDAGAGCFRVLGFEPCSCRRGASHVVPAKVRAHYFALGFFRKRGEKEETLSEILFFFIVESSEAVIPVP